MLLPVIDPSNVASVLALAGLMNVTGASARFRDARFGELDVAITSEVLVVALQRRLRQMSDFPDEASLAWWRKEVTSAVVGKDLDLAATLCALAGEINGELVHSQWRLVGGQQRWIKQMKAALVGSLPQGTIDSWLRATRWPRSVPMSMTGVDGSAYQQASKRFNATNTQCASWGHPVSLWLMFEGIRLFPVQPSTVSPTPGWRDKWTVRYPIWNAWMDAEMVRCVWNSSWLMVADLDSQSVPVIDEVDPEPDDFITSARQLLHHNGVADIREARKYYDPAPYYARLAPAYFV